MKIAVASQTQKTISGHLGHCLKFWVFETNETEILSKSLLELSPDQSFHNSLPDETHPLNDVDVLICGGMGKGLAKNLAEKGIEPAITKETDIDKAVAAYLDGSLVTEEAECGSEHGHKHDRDRENCNDRHHEDGNECTGEHRHEHRHQHGRHHGHKHEADSAC